MVCTSRLECFKPDSSDGKRQPHLSPPPTYLLCHYLALVTRKRLTHATRHFDSRFYKSHRPGKKFGGFVQTGILCVYYLFLSQRRHWILNHYKCRVLIYILVNTLGAPTSIYSGAFASSSRLSFVYDEKIFTKCQSQLLYHALPSKHYLFILTCYYILSV